MTRCTVCGATSREGAKYCTSCGTRLVDENDATTTTGEPDTSNPASSATEASVPAIDPGDTASSSPDAPESPAPADDRYISSWPGAARETGATSVPAEPAEATDSSPSATAPAPPPPEAAEMSWPSAGPAPEEQAEDANAEPASVSDASSNGNAPWPVESRAVDNTSEDATSTESPGDSSQDGPAPWTPTAAGEPSTRDASGTSTSDRFGRIHELIDELQLRIERIQDPATLASRELNPDDLADQLDRWARQVPNTDELLGTLREVRRSPKDIDALQQLSAHAADLELLVRHYQSITAKSDEWSAALRRLRDASPGS